MNQPPLHPSLALKWASALSRALLWTVATGWLLFVLTLGAIHAVIVPRIGDWRPELESVATRALGVPVRIGSIHAESVGLIPSFELRNVKLLDSQGRDSLVLTRVLTALSVTSLWRLGFEQIYIDQPELDIRRLNNGQLEVAGLRLFQGVDEPAASNAGADWFFSQSEFAIKGGRIHWTDDLRGHDRVTLNQVDLVVRNPGWRHEIRVDATPAEGLGQRISLRADLTSPFWSLHPGRWTEWSGTLFGELPAVDLARLAVPADLGKQIGLKLSNGTGALRLWLDLSRGHVTGGTTDVALVDVSGRFAHASRVLAFPELSGRMTLALKPAGWDLTTQDLRFETQGGTRWTNGNLKLRQTAQTQTQVTDWELDASHIQLDALRELADGLPLQAEVQHQLAELKPSGTVESLKLRWTNTAQGWERFNANGKVTGLALAAQVLPNPTPEQPATPPLPGRPGFGGASLEFEFTHEGGHAKLNLSQGHLEFPGVFEEPLIPMDKLAAEMRWRVHGDQIQAQLTGVRFSNPDMEGQATATWRTSDPAVSPGKSRFPGVLKLDGTIARGKGERVHRYLPLVIAHNARQYVKDAIVSGKAKDVRFHVAGDLYQMPFRNPADGEFHIAAKVSDVSYAFVPPSFAPQGTLPWPALKHIDGELVFDRLSMSLNGAKGNIADAPGLRVVQAQARIANLDHHPVVEVNAKIDGPLMDALGVVRRSPLSSMTSQALQSSTGTGNAQIQFGLNVPLMDVATTSVTGKVTLPGNDLLITPDSPLLGRVKGLVEFNDQGFNVPQASARFLGGDLQFSGGMKSQDGVPTILFKGQGVATAEGLRTAPHLGLASVVAERATGTTSYAAQWMLRQGVPQISVQTNLQGLALALPEPLGKAMESSMPLRYSNRVVDASTSAPATGKAVTRKGGADPLPPTPTQDTLSLEVGTTTDPLLAVTYIRNLTDKNLGIDRGQLLVGHAARTRPPLPNQGVSAHIDWPRVDADQWDQVMTALLTPAADNARTGNRTEALHSGSVLQDAMPNGIALKTQQLKAAGKLFHNVTLDASRRGNTWLAGVTADELQGRLEYLPTQGKTPGKLTARLDRLMLKTAGDPPPSQPPSGDSAPARNDPAAMPALDVEVNALELDGRALGLLELQAVNRLADGNAREWRLSKLNLRLPEAHLTATGNWADLSGPEAPGAQANPSGKPRRTALSFKLDVKDSGALLQRFGMVGVFKGGKGHLDGNLAWLGAPTAFDTGSLSGQVKLDMASGQFLKAEPGLAKLLGVLSLQSLPRRLTLDFSDVFSQGFAFDFIRGDALIERGVARTNNLQMKGVNAAVLLEGQADIGKETQDVRALVVPEINAGTASLIATVINPAVGLGTFLAQAFLRQPLIQASTQAFRIHGTWADPQVDKVDAPAPAPAAAPPTPPDAAPGTTTH